MGRRADELMERVYGPYKRNDERYSMVFWNPETDTYRSQSYPRYLMEQHLGRVLSRDEEVHHRNGDHSDNRMENLVAVSAAEHRALHKRGPRESRPCENCNDATTNKRFCSPQCRSFAARKVQRPSREELGEAIASIPYVRIGAKYGVSDNTIRKWAKQYDLT